MMYECEFDVWTVDVCVQVGFGQMVWIDGNQFPVRRHLAACMTHDLRTEVQCISIDRERKGKALLELL